MAAYVENCERFREVCRALADFVNEKSGLGPLHDPSLLISLFLLFLFIVGEFRKGSVLIYVVKISPRLRSSRKKPRAAAATPAAERKQAKCHGLDLPK